MRAPKKNRKATFFWQALLIVLPVIVLATFGFLSLRQDKVLAQNEAAERAQGLADNLLPQLWTALTQIDIHQKPGGHPTFQVDTAGQLLFPPATPPWPMPRPFDLAALTVEQARLWRTAQRAEAEKQNAVAAQAYQDLLSLNPSKGFSAAAHYSLGLLLEKQDRINEAVENLKRIIEKF